MKKKYVNKEEDIILSLQKLPLSGLMRYISKLLNTDLYIFTILFLYFKNYIGNEEIKYIIYGQIFAFSLKLIFSRKDHTKVTQKLIICQKKKKQHIHFQVDIVIQQ